MSIVKLALISILSLCLVHQAAAQQLDENKIDSLFASKPFRLAVGMKYAFTNQYEFGVTAKYFILSKGALEAGYSSAAYREARLLSLMYERHANLYKKRKVLVYYGGGIAVLNIPKETYRDLIGRDYKSTQVGIGIIVGAEKSLGKLPLSVSLDTKSTYFRKRGDNPVGKTSLTNAALGLKYTFN